jgi:hypothetical protein
VLRESVGSVMGFYQCIGVVRRAMEVFSAKFK